MIFPLYSIPSNGLDIFVPIEYLLHTSFTLGEAASATLVDLLRTLGDLFPVSPTHGAGVSDCNSRMVAVASSIIGVKFLVFYCFVC